MEDYPRAEIGERIRAKRAAKQMSREQLAELAKLSVQGLSNIETGKKEPLAGSIYRICLALNVSSDHILFGKPDSKREIEYDSLALADLSQEDKEKSLEFIGVVTEILKRYE